MCKTSFTVACMIILTKQQNSNSKYNNRTKIIIFDIINITSLSSVYHSIYLWFFILKFGVNFALFLNLFLYKSPNLIAVVKKFILFNLNF